MERERGRKREMVEVVGGGGGGSSSDVYIPVKFSEQPSSHAPTDLQYE